jgi:ribosome maturation factor RimP
MAPTPSSRPAVDSQNDPAVPRPTQTSDGLAVRLFAQLEPVLAAAQYELVDIETDSVAGSSVIRVLLDRSADHPLGPRIDLLGVTDATHVIDDYLEAHDPVAEAFTLEVSSPGLERPLRKPPHFARFVHAEISVKTKAGTAGDRRIQGVLEAADPDPDGGITLAGRVIPYAAIERARSVFRWGEEEGPPTPSGQPRKKGALPKGQRPIHPKALQNSADSTPSPRDDAKRALASQTPTTSLDLPDSTKNTPEVAP